MLWIYVSQCACNAAWWAALWRYRSQSVACLDASSLCSVLLLQPPSPQFPSPPGVLGLLLLPSSSTQPSSAHPLPPRADGYYLRSSTMVMHASCMTCSHRDRGSAGATDGPLLLQRVPHPDDGADARRQGHREAGLTGPARTHTSARLHRRCRPVGRCPGPCAEALALAAHPLAAAHAVPPAHHRHQALLQARVSRQACTGGERSLACS